ncbi:MAG: twitching motility protein [Moraxellaceae bacterium]|nr:MAG: twitching motility protein [Moraxellaceae bacterium]
MSITEALKCWPDFFVGALEAAKLENASDVHIGECAEIRIRQAGRLTVLNHPKWHACHFDIAIEALCSEAQQAILEAHHSVDLAYATPDGQRYRINIYRQRGRWALAARILPREIRDLSSMNLPPVLEQFTAYHSGLVLVTGATGSGKSTTLASMINIINRQRECHILTIEDPVEYQHQDIKAMVHQREVHADTCSYSNAVRAALRQDPDVILIGEMRDLDTMRSAMSAAETGHLVFSTLHTSDSVGAINRIIGSFPAQEQTLVRQQLSLVLRAVVTQRLLPNPDFTQRFPALEILLVNTAVANLIRNNKPEQIYSVMESSRSSGMMTLEQSLAELVNQQCIDEITAVRAANNPHGMQRYLSDRAELSENNIVFSNASSNKVSSDNEVRSHSVNSAAISTGKKSLNSLQEKLTAFAQEKKNTQKKDVPQKGFTIEPQ